MHKSVKEKKINWTKVLILCGISIRLSLVCKPQKMTMPSVSKEGGCRQVFVAALHGQMARMWIMVSQATPSRISFSKTRRIYWVFLHLSPLGSIVMDGGIGKEEEAQGVGGASREMTSSLSSAMWLLGRGLAIHCDELGSREHRRVFPGPGWFLDRR